jgi:leucyl-tRNA synthetase
VNANAKDNEIESIALVDENVVKFVEGKNIVKTIVVPNKLVNIVAR